jgi:hypothetical protein
MSPRKSSPLENVLGRVDDLDQQNLAILVQRLARERRLLETVFNTIREGKSKTAETASDYPCSSLKAPYPRN